MSLTTHVQSAYEKQYQDDQSQWREMGAKQKVKNIRELTQGMSFKRVLEVGAGDGSLLKNLSEQAFAEELHALEISGSALQKIKSRNIPQVVSAQLFDGYTIPFEDNTFDLVILSHVLEHVEFERKLLRELQRVARYQVIEVPKDYRYGVDTKVKHFLSYGHINVYTPSSLRFLLRTEGFSILRQKIDLYSKETYEYMAGHTSDSNQKVSKSAVKGALLYYAKRFLVSIPIKSIRDHFANTITVLVKAENDQVGIF